MTLDSPRYLRAMGSPSFECMWKLPGMFVLIRVETMYLADHEDISAHSIIEFWISSYTLVGLFRG